MTNESPLTGERIRLRALEPEDLDLLFRWENDTETWRVSETLTPISKYILKRYLENAHRDIYETKQLRLIIETTDHLPAGTIDLSDFDPFHRRAAVGILIAEKGQRRKGLAGEALDLLCSYCFGILKLHQLYCSITSDNEASLALFRKAGFRITGTREQWRWDGERFIDEYFLQRLQ